MKKVRKVCRNKMNRLLCLYIGCDLRYDKNNKTFCIKYLCNRNDKIGERKHGC